MNPTRTVDAALIQARQAHTRVKTAIRDHFDDDAVVQDLKAAVKALGNATDAIEAAIGLLDVAKDKDAELPTADRISSVIHDAMVVNGRLLDFDLARKNPQQEVLSDDVSGEFMLIGEAMKEIAQRTRSILNANRRHNQAGTVAQEVNASNLRAALLKIDAAAARVHNSAHLNRYDADGMTSAIDAFFNGLVRLAAVCRASRRG